jgi:glycosyltransferase involved in cell wall biosynthesis
MIPSSAVHKETTGDPARSSLAAPGLAVSRVLHINNGNLYGGVETMLVTLARFRDQYPALEPHFAICEEGLFSRELAATGVPIYRLGKVRISRPWTVLRARRKLRELLRSEHFDLVICHMPWSTAVFGPAVNAAGQRLGFWAHAVPRGGGWLETLARRAKPDLAIANSHYTEAGLDKLFPRSLHGVVYPAVSMAALDDVNKRRVAMRRELNVADGTVVIVQVSRLERWKGQLIHLQALARLKNVDTPWVCWLVGGAQGPGEEQYLSQLQRTVVELGLADRVRFLGQRSDVPAVLASADIFCQPNETPEPFGVCLVEALWAGKPVVTSAFGGAMEIVNESCGLLIKLGDVEGLAQSLEKLIASASLRIRLGEAGVARARSLCDPASQMEKLRNLMSMPKRQLV